VLSCRDLQIPCRAGTHPACPNDLGALVRKRTPCVVGETAGGFELLLGRTDLEACRGDVLCLEAVLRRAVDEAGPAGESPPRAA